MNGSDLRNTTVLIRGAGDLASGVAARLVRCGFPVVMTELAQPLMVRRLVSFGEAVYAGEITVEGIRARLAPDVRRAQDLLAMGVIPVLVDPMAECRRALRPAVVVDAIVAKRNTGTSRTDAPLVIALGPGFTAGSDCHAVIETNRGHWLGRVLWSGGAQPDTAVPGEVSGRQGERVLRAPMAGAVEAHAEIGEMVAQGKPVASVAGTPVRAPFSGVLRGLIHPGLHVPAGLKIGDLDPRGERDHCVTISDKSLAIAGGVLEAILAARQDTR